MSSIENKIFKQTQDHTDLRNGESWDNLDIEKVRKIIEGEINNDTKNKFINNNQLSKEKRARLW